MRSPAEVRDDARAADGTSEEVRKLLENLKPLLAADAAAAAHDAPRGVESNGSRERLLPPHDSHEKVLVTQGRREFLDRRRHAGGLRLDYVRCDGEQLRRTREPRLFEQAAAPALPRESQGVAVDLRVDDVRRQWDVEPRRDAREHPVPPAPPRPPPPPPPP